MLAVQVATTAGVAGVVALFDLHASAPAAAAALSFAALVAAWGRLAIALQAAPPPPRELVLLGVALLLAYALVYTALPDGFSGARPAPELLPGAHRLVDALYFTTTTATTVGFGDQAPLTTFARLLVMSQYAAAACMAVLIANHVASPSAAP